MGRQFSASESMECVAAAADGIGRLDFYHGLLQACLGELDADSAQVMYFRRGRRSQYFETYKTPEDIQSLYLSSYSRQCPMQHHWDRNPRADVVRMQDARQPDFDYRKYFDIFYRATGLRDEIGMFLPIADGYAIGLFLEREGYFKPNDVALLGGLLPGFLGIHRANVRTLVTQQKARRGIPLDDREPFALFDAYGGLVLSSKNWRGSADVRRVAGNCRVAALGESFPLAPGGFLCFAQGPDRNGTALSLPFLIEELLSLKLTKRERDVFGQILQGRGVKSSAVALGVSANTVKVHRKNLFSKLDVTSERELLLIVIGCLQSNKHDTGGREC